ncbi:MAG: flagellar hook-associated protein 2 [Thermoleophilales bacterium]|jgi:flagellar hook-associated protein 2|nr:flagellar hook-associated protein 2 [Thermoleophilales bacterium]
MAGIQLGGLSSGLDTEGMISQLMQLEAQPGVRMQQQKMVSQAREQSLRDILSRVKNLQLEAKNLKSAGTWADTQSVESGDTGKITATRVAGAAPGIYSISVSQLASGDQWSYAYAPPVAATSFTITQGTASQVVNVGAAQTLDDTVAAINADANSKVYAVNVAGKLVLSSRDTGSAAAFTVSPAGPGQVLDGGARTRTAVDATYSLDGGATSKTSASNVVKDGIAGIEFTLKSLVPTGTPVNLNVSAPGTDQSAVKDKIKNFVEQYNSTVDLIRSKLTEQKVKDAKTDSDRAKGNLYNDSMLQGLLTRMRTSVGGTFATGDAATDQLQEIGITTGVATGAAASAESVAGKLVIDDAKLTAALASKPLTVRKLLGGTTGVDGVGTNIDTLLDPVVKTDGDFDGRLKAADKEQKRYDDQIATLNKRIDAKATMLRAQFAAMESALSRSKSQQQWLAGQLP